MSKLKDLFEAIRTANSAAFYRLVEEIDLSTADEHGQTATHVAAEMRNPDYLEAVLDRGAPVDARDENGLTPLYLVAQIILCEEFALDDNFEETAELLINNGADIEVLNRKSLDDLTSEDEYVFTTLQRIREYAVTIASEEEGSTHEERMHEAEEEECDFATGGGGSGNATGTDAPSYSSDGHGLAVVKTDQEYPMGFVPDFASGGWGFGET